MTFHVQVPMPADGEITDPPNIDPVEPKPQEIVPANDDNSLAAKAKRSDLISTNAELDSSFEAKLRKASKITGFSTQMLRNIDTRLLFKKRQDWNAIAEENPKIAEYIGKDPTNAAIIGDNLESLKEVERVTDTMQSRRMRSLFGLASALEKRDRVLALVEEERGKRNNRTSVVDTASEAYDFGRENTVGLGRAYFQKYMNDDPSQDNYIAYMEDKWGGREPASGALSFVIGMSAESVPLMFETSKKGVEYGIASATAAAVTTAFLGQMGPQAAFPEEIATVPLSAAAFGAAGFKFGMTTDMATLFAGHNLKMLNDLETESGEKMNTFVRKGMGIAMGGVEAALERVGFSALAKIFKPAVGNIRNRFATNAIKAAMKDKKLSTAMAEVGKRYVAAIGTETSTEVMQEASQILGTWLAVNIDEIATGKEFKEGQAEVFTGGNFKRLFESGQAGMAGAIGLGFAGVTINTVVIGSDFRAAEEHATELNDLNDAVQKSKLNASSTETMSELLQSMGIDSNEYIDGEAAAQLWDEGAGDIFKKIGIERDQITSARDLGETVELPVNDLVRNLTQQEFAIIAPILKANSASLSLQDTRTRTMAEEAQTMAAKTKEGLKDVVAFESEMKRINGEIVNAGRTKVEADGVVDLLRAFGLRTAQRSKDLQVSVEAAATRFAQRITIKRADKKDVERVNANGTNINVDMTNRFNMRVTNAEQFYAGNIKEDVADGDILLANYTANQKKPSKSKVSNYAYAVVPRGTSQEVINSLKDSGMKVAEYEKGDLASRATELRELARGDEVLQTAPRNVVQRVKDAVTGKKPVEVKQDGKQIQGSLISDEKYLITLFEGSNESTLLHETGHVFLEEMQALISEGKADQSLINDYNAILEHIGAEQGQEITRDSHETFARTFEAWLMEGAAPSASLNKAFKRFRTWLTRIYRSVVGLENDSGLSLNMNDDVRELFDRMLATDRELEETAATNELTNLNAAELEAIIETEEQRDDLRDLREKGIQESVAKVEALRRKGINKKIKGWRADGARIVDEMPVNKAMSQIIEDGGLNLLWLKSNVGNKVLKKLRSLGVIAKREIIGDDPNSFNTEAIDRDAEIESLLPSDQKSASGIPLDNGNNNTIINAVDDIGGINKPKKLTNEFDDSPNLRGNVGKIYKRKAGLAPDQVAKELQGLGFGDGSVKTMWQLISDDNTNRIESKERVKELNASKFNEDVGALPDEYALINGYENGSEMIQEMIQLESRRKQIKIYVDNKIQAEENAVLGEEAILQSPEFATHIEKVGELIRQKLIKNNLSSGESKLTKQQYEDFAESRLSSMTINGAIRTAKFMGELKTANRKMRQHLVSNRKGSLEKALKENIKARKSFELAKRSLEVRKTVEKAIKKAKQIRKAKAGTIEEQFHQNALAIIERYELVKGVSKVRRGDFVRMSLIDLLQGISDDTMDISNQFSDELKSELVSMNFQKMSLESFEEMFALLSTVAHQGRDLNKRKLADSQLTLLEGATAIERLVIDNASREARNDMESRLPQDEAGRFWASFLASHRKVSSLVKEMSGFKDGNIMWELIIRPMNKAADTEASMMAESTRALDKLFSLYTKNEQAAWHKKESIGNNGLYITRMGRLMAALNMGNEDSFGKLIDGQTGITGEQATDILNSLEKKDIDFVNGIWAHFAAQWPEVRAVHKRVTGLTLEGVTGRSMTATNGTLTGGYFPLAYDSRRSAQAEANETTEAAKASLRGAAISAQTKHGNRKARVDGVTMPVRLDFGVIAEKLQESIHDVTHFEFVRDTNRLLKKEQVQTAIRDHYGVEVYRQFTGLIEDIAVGEQRSTNFMDKVLGHVRIGSSIAAMGWSVKTALLQPLGFTQTIKIIGFRAAFRGLTKYLGGAIQQEGVTAFVRSKAEMMENRAITQNREINEIRNKVMRSKGIVRAKFDQALGAATLGKVDSDNMANSFFYMITKMQQIVDVITWLGAYERYMEEFGDDAKAVALANQAVLDSQGGGQVKDLANVQRGSQAQKLWTNFYSYFNVLYNLSVESVKSTDFRNPKSIGILAVDYMTLYIIPASLQMLAFEALRGDEPEEDLTERLIAENLSYMASTMFGFRELSSAIKGFAGYDGPAGARFFAEAGKLVKAVSNGKADKQLLKAMNSAGGILFHYPSGQVQRTIDGITAIADGKTANPAAIVLGPPRK